MSFSRPALSSFLFLALGLGVLATACAQEGAGTTSNDQFLDEAKKLATSSEALVTYLKSIAQGSPGDSWSKRNGLLRNHGCASAGSPLECLTAKPEFTLRGESIVGPAKGQLEYRILNLLGGGSLGPNSLVASEAERPMPIQETRFWIRSSAAGRYVGMSDFVLDLERWEAKSKGAMIKISAPFDPQFTADDKTLSWAKTSAEGITVCRQSALEETADDQTAAFDFDDDSCTMINKGVYQSFGTSLDSALPMFMTDSADAHTNDAGLGKIEAVYKATATTQFTPLRFNGTAFDVLTPTQVALPFEGDLILSPSARLFISRLSDGVKQTGYRISRIEAAPQGTSFTVKATEVGSIALRGAKASFSFDERFVVTHSYADQADPSLSIAEGAADIVLVDLLTGLARQLTKMPAGVRALYPHFRSDGWMYFLVRDSRGAEKREYVLATDAALRVAAK